jgi:threonylcarbamoyladenosine tRNA methylthiotransferase MtaB
MRIYLHTFGCKANQYDTEVVRQAVESAGASAVSDPGLADVAIVNSCTVTQAGEAKMRRFVRRLHRRRRDVQTVIMGCAAARDDGSLAKLPGVAAVVAGADTAAILQALGLETSVDPLLRSFPRGTRAWLKIQDGCDEHCTFCATTLARGANRSRPTGEILREAEVLSAHHREIVLTGVHIGTYGRDLEDGSSLGVLVERLIAEVSGTRFRLSSVEATEVDERLTELMRDAPGRLASHLHAPLQSGSDAVLKRMGRHWYTAASYRERCERLAAELPAFGLGADVMVGFPGESDHEFRATRSLVEALPFTYLHVFPYSERPGASATRLGPPVDGVVTAARSAELRELAAAKGAAYRAGRNGGRADVVALRRLGGRVQGLTEDYLDVGFAADRGFPSRFSAVLRHEPGGALMAEAA